MSEPVLVDLAKPFEIECDACSECLGAVHLQEGHVIAHESRRLNEQEHVLGIYLITCGGNSCTRFLEILSSRKSFHNKNGSPKHQVLHDSNQVV